MKLAFYITEGLWTDFCESKESTKDADKLKRIIFKTNNSPVSILKGYETWAQYNNETKSLLLDTFNY